MAELQRTTIHYCSMHFTNMKLLKHCLKKMKWSHSHSPQNINSFRKMWVFASQSSCNMHNVFFFEFWALCPFFAQASCSGLCFCQAKSVHNQFRRLEERRDCDQTPRRPRDVLPFAVQKHSYLILASKCAWNKPFVPHLVIHLHLPSGLEPLRCLMAWNLGITFLPFFFRCCHWSTGWKNSARPEGRKRGRRFGTKVKTWCTTPKKEMVQKLRCWIFYLVPDGFW